MPEAAREFTDAGAEAFVRYYWDVVSYAQTTLDTEPLKAVSNPTCEVCSRGIQGLERIRQLDGVSSGGTLTVSNVKVARERAGSLESADVTMTVSNAAQKIDLPGDKDDVSLPASSAPYKVVLLWDGSDWEVSRIQERS